MRRSFKKFLERKRGKGGGSGVGKFDTLSVPLSSKPFHGLLSIEPESFARSPINWVLLLVLFFSFFFFFHLAEKRPPPLSYRRVSFELQPSLFPRSSSASINLDPHEIALLALFHSLDSTNEPSFLPSTWNKGRFLREFNSHRATKLIIINRNWLSNFRYQNLSTKNNFRKVGYQGY